MYIFYIFICIVIQGYQECMLVCAQTRVVTTHTPNSSLHSMLCNNDSTSTPLLPAQKVKSFHCRGGQCIYLVCIYYMYVLIYEALFTYRARPLVYPKKKKNPNPNPIFFEYLFRRGKYNYHQNIVQISEITNIFSLFIEIEAYTIIFHTRI